MINWKFTDNTQTVVFRLNEDGSSESCLIESISDWLAEGNTPEPADPIIESIPQAVSKAQGIAAMQDLGVWASVKGWFETQATDNDRDLFNAITEFNRASPLLESVKSIIGITDEQVDQLFVLAASKVV